MIKSVRLSDDYSNIIIDIEADTQEESDEECKRFLEGVLGVLSPTWNISPSESATARDYEPDLSADRLPKHTIY